ncbi:MAG: hypothetical protein WC966_04310 [Bradymonadales bacterium]|jgi:hypothetical protein
MQDKEKKARARSSKQADKFKKSTDVNTDVENELSVEQADEERQAGESDLGFKGVREDVEQGRDAKDAEKDDFNDDEKTSFFEKTLGVGWSLGSLVKKTLKGSLNSLFMSEDGLAQSLSEMALPKEISAFILQYAESSKKEFTRILSKEVKSFLESADFYNELRKFLSSIQLEIHASIAFKERAPLQDSDANFSDDMKLKIDDLELNLHKSKENSDNRVEK